MQCGNKVERWSGVISSYKLSLYTIKLFLQPESPVLPNREFCFCFLIQVSVNTGQQSVKMYISFFFLHMTLLVVFVVQDACQLILDGAFGLTGSCPVTEGKENMRTNYVQF